MSHSNLTAPEWGSSAWDALVVAADDENLLSDTLAHPEAASAGAASCGSNSGSTSSQGGAYEQQRQQQLNGAELQQLPRTLSDHETLAAAVGPLGSGSQGQITDAKFAQRQQRQQQQQLQQQQWAEAGDLWAPQSAQKAPARPRIPIPGLDLSKMRPSGSSGAGAFFAHNLPEEQVPAVGEEAQEDASQRAFEATMRWPINPAAPVVDNRCYVYKAVHPQELQEAEALISSLPDPEASHVRAIWDALLVARRDCESMAARGVRVSRDVSRDWQETVSDLIDRVVAQDNEITDLKSQLKQAQAAAAQAAAAAGAAGAMEELHAQVARLRRHRDRLAKDNQDLVAALGKAHATAEAAGADATAARSALDAARSKGAVLRQQHAELLRRHIDVAQYAEQLEGEVYRWRTATVSPSAAAGTSGSIQSAGARKLLPPAMASCGAIVRSGGSGGSPGTGASSSVVEQHAASSNLGRRNSPRGMSRGSPRSSSSQPHALSIASPTFGSKLGPPSKDRPWALEGGRASPVMGGAIAIDRRMDRQLEERDHLAEDQEPLPGPAGIVQLAAMHAAKQQGQQGLQYGQQGQQVQWHVKAREVDWRGEVEYCARQLEALGGLHSR